MRLRWYLSIDTRTNAAVPWVDAACAGVHKSAMLRRVPQAAAVVLLYGGLVCWLTWPLAAHVASELPAASPATAYDPLYSAWVLAWQSHTLARGSLDIANANIFYPERDAFFYGPGAFGALPYFAPVYLLTGNPALALNLLFLGCATLTAVTVHLVVRAWTNLHAAGLVAGVTFLANRWLLWMFVPTTPHFSVLCYFPLIIFLSASPMLGIGSTVLLLALVVLQGMTDLVYVAPAVVIPVAVLALIYLARVHTRARGLRLLAVTALAGLAMLAIQRPYLFVAARNPGLQEQTYWRVDPSKSPLDLPWGLMGFMSPLAVPSLALLIILGAGVLIIARRWRGTTTDGVAWRHAMLWAGVGIAISLPLRVSWGGHAYTLPHLALAHRWVPLIASVRLPERLRVAPLGGVALLAGLAFAEIARHLGLADCRIAWRRLLRGGAAVALCVAMYAQYRYAIGQPQAYGPAFPATYPTYRVDEIIRRESAVLRVLRESGGPTVEVPLPRRAPVPALPSMHAAAMYRSIFHWQPLLNGYGSYWPARFPALMEMAARLPDPQAVRDLRRETGLAFILVRASSRLPADAYVAKDREIWLDLARRGGRPDLELIASDEDLLLFAVKDESAG